MLCFEKLVPCEIRIRKKMYFTTVKLILRLAQSTSKIKKDHFLRKD